MLTEYGTTFFLLNVEQRLPIVLLFVGGGVVVVIFVPQYCDDDKQEAKEAYHWRNFDVHCVEDFGVESLWGRRVARQ